MSRARRLSLVLGLLYSAAAQSSAQSSALSPDALLEKLRLQERMMPAAKARFTAERTTTGTVLWDGAWTYEQGKVLLEGSILMRPPNGEASMHPEVYAFDGNVLRTFRIDPDRQGGTIRDVGFDLGSLLSPERMLGFGLNANGRHTLLDVLESSPSVATSPAELDGRAVIRVDALVPVWLQNQNQEWSAGEGLARLWLDPERQFRPLRIEQYYDQEGERLFSLLDHIALEEINGLWLPVEGRLTPYGKTIEIINGMTMEELEKYALEVGIEVARGQIREVYAPQLDDANTIRISGWEVLGDVEDSVFVYRFPSGAHVWDGILQRSLVVGEDGQLVVHDLLREMAAAGSTETLTRSGPSAGLDRTAAPSANPSSPAPSRIRAMDPASLLIALGALFVLGAMTLFVLRRVRRKD